MVRGRERNRQILLCVRGVAPGVSIIAPPASVQLGISLLKYEQIPEIQGSEILPSERVLARWRVDYPIAVYSDQRPGLSSPFYFLNMEVRSLTPGAGVQVQLRSSHNLTAFNNWESATRTPTSGFSGLTRGTSRLGEMFDPAFNVAFIQLSIADAGTGSGWALQKSKLVVALNIPRGATITRLI